MPFLRTLQRDLVSNLHSEVALTLKVAVMTSAGLSRAEVVRRTESSEVEVKMALLRLQHVAEGWT